jgi:hypothetical protein
MGVLKEETGRMAGSRETQNLTLNRCAWRNIILFLLKESIIYGQSLNLSPCVLGPYTLRMHIWLLKHRLGCHLCPYTLKMQICSLNLASGDIQVPKLLKCRVLPLTEHVIFQAFKQAISFIGTSRLNLFARQLLLNLICNYLITPSLV